MPLPCALHRGSGCEGICNFSEIGRHRNRDGDLGDECDSLAVQKICAKSSCRRCFETLLRTKTTCLVCVSRCNSWCMEKPNPASPGSGTPSFLLSFPLYHFFITPVPRSHFHTSFLLLCPRLFIWVDRLEVAGWFSIACSVRKAQRCCYIGNGLAGRQGDRKSVV